MIKYLSLTYNCSCTADNGRDIRMKEEGRYFVLKQKAVPEVLLKVVEAKRLLDSGKVMTEALFTNTKMIFFLFMTVLRDGRSLFPYRSMMNRVFCQMY